MYPVSRTAASWSLKPIFGREIREKAMEKFFKELPGDLAKLNSVLLKNQDFYKFRLLCTKDDNQPKAILVYQRNLSARCLKVEVLSPLDIQTREISEVYLPLIKELKEEAKEMKAASIEMVVPKSEGPVAYALVQNGFQRTRNSIIQSEIECELLSIEIEPKKQLKRRRDDSEEGESVSKKARHDLRTDYTNRLQSVESRASQKPYEVTLMGKYIKAIQNGSKTIEGRINSGMFKNNFREGLLVRFYDRFNPTCYVLCKVLRVKTYSSFDEMLRNEGFQRCIPGAKSLEAASGIYKNIPGYDERSRQHGVLAIELKSLGESKNDSACN